MGDGLCFGWRSECEWCGPKGRVRGAEGGRVGRVALSICGEESDGVSTGDGRGDGLVHEDSRRLEHTSIAPSSSITAPRARAANLENGCYM